MLNRIKNLLHNDIFAIIIINSVFFLISYRLFGVKYEVNDDFAISMFTSQSYGQNFSFLGFTNSIYTHIIGLIQSALPFINWHVALQLIFSFLSIVVICFLIRKKFNRNISYILILLFLSLLTSQYYVSFQFTKNSALYILTGSMLLLDALHYKIKIKNIILGYFLIEYGSLLRFENTFMILTFVFVLCIYDLFFHQKMIFDKVWINKFLKYAGIFALLFVIIFGFRIVDTIMTNKNPDASYYTQYTKARSQLLDFGTAEYESNIEGYNKLNISEKDLKMFKGWTFTDPDKFSLDALNKMVDLKYSTDKKINLLAVVKDTIKSILYYTNLYSYKTILLFIFLLYFVLLKPKQHYFPYLIGGIVLSLYFYLNYIGRVLPRVELGIWVAAIIFSLFYFDWNELRESKYVQKLKDEINHMQKQKKLINLIKILICIFLIINCVKVSIDSIPITDYCYKNFVNIVNQDKEAIYFIDVQTFSPFQESYNALETLKIGEYSNIYFLGGWQVETTPVNQVLKNYNIRNPFIDVIDNEHAFIVDNFSIFEKVDYINRNYKANVKAVLVKTVEVFKIYKIVTIE